MQLGSLLIEFVHLVCQLSLCFRQLCLLWCHNLDHSSKIIVGFGDDVDLLTCFLCTHPNARVSMSQESLKITASKNDPQKSRSSTRLPQVNTTQHNSPGHSVTLTQLISPASLFPHVGASHVTRRPCLGMASQTCHRPRWPSPICTAPHMPCSPKNYTHLPLPLRYFVPGLC